MSDPWRKTSRLELRRRADALHVPYTSRTTRRDLYRAIQEASMEQAKQLADERRNDQLAADALRAGGLDDERADAIMGDWRAGRGDVDVIEHRTAGRPAIPSDAEWTTIERMAAALFQAKMVRARGFVSEADVAVVLLAARGLNLDPFMATQKINVIDGRASLSAEIMVGLVRSAGYRIEQVEMTAERAVARGVRGDESATVTWTIEDARRAQLLHKDNWKKYPMAMLWARAVSQVCRVLFPDVLCGLSYTPDELEDFIDAESYPSNVSEPISATVAVAYEDSPMLPDDCEETDREHDYLTCCKFVIRNRIEALPGIMRQTLADEWKRRQLTRLERLREADRVNIGVLLDDAEALEGLPDPVPDVNVSTTGKLTHAAGPATTVTSPLLNPPCDTDTDAVTTAYAATVAAALCPSCGVSIAVDNPDCQQHPF